MELILLCSVFSAEPECGTPLECYTKAIGALKQDREEMRRQLENYQNLYKNAMDEITTLKKSLEESKLEIKQGQVSMGGECNYMYQGSGERTCRIIVYFDREFKETPKISYSIHQLDLSGSSNRLNAYISDLSRVGFTKNLYTWDDSKVWNSSIKWTAFGK